MLFRRRAASAFVRKLLYFALICGLLWLLWLGLRGVMSTGESDQVLEALNKFYTMEQAGNFGGSWEIFHSQMKKRFEKSTYVQQRAHVFMQDMGIDTFTFELSEPQAEYDIRTEQSGDELGKAYRITVTQHYKTRFGAFDIVQPCYVTQEGEEWRVLWIYEDKE
ncbi:hypothetical protein HPL003_14015 [Paenibacillus terrae HPL-003]|uniref:DUF4878 domain-containing protein n=1 Tax=Paenibacillus terrae (strain HPL-003) TaxID=985665 RepID=G7W0D3_PAETH|nr:hypothetical protein [Paenibacillus terrae]AET59554.1 hypothetical protein HPL003_14015 [Paenibacillus terrae HPL-003]